MINIKRRAINVLKKCWIFFAIVFVTLAIVFSCFRALTPFAAKYKVTVEKQLSKMVGQPVHITGMKTSWYWFEPVLKLENITIAEHQKTVLKLDKLLVGINIFSSLWHWQIQPGILFIEDVKLSIREEEDHWSIDGIGFGKEVKFDPREALPMLGWLLAQQKIMVKNISAMIHLKDGALLPVSHLNISATNDSGHYLIHGQASLAQTMPTRLSFLGDLHINPSNLDALKGEVYVSVTDLLPTQWQNFLPPTEQELLGGKGNIKLWVDFNKGGIKSVQSEIDVGHIAWKHHVQNKNYFIQHLSANLAWKPVEDGWQLSGVKINLQLAGKNWPENKLLIKYRKSVDDYSMYFKTIDLNSLFNLDIDWPDKLKSVAAAKPIGTLHDTQLHLIDHKPGVFLTRFEGLGLKGSEQWPGVSGVSGVLSWQPNEGRLELDSNGMLISPHNLPPVFLSKLNGAVDWKELSHGLRVSLDRFVLTRPDLVISGRGQIDQALTNPNLKLEGLYSLQQAEKWLQYIPSKGLKPKLNHWLKHDIKRIGKLTGRVNVDGPMAEFPFDKGEGIFLVSSYFSGVDLYFNDKWPIATDIDGYLRVNERNLEADILKGNLADMDMGPTNLTIGEIGYDRETMLIHNQSQVDSKKLLNLAMNSPLKEKLSKLKEVEMFGPVTADIRLEIPLYPENDEILARGKIDYDENEFIFHHPSNDFELKQVKGTLFFDEHGILDSTLKAVFMDDPVDMSIKSVRGKQPYTEVSLEGQTTIELLKSKFDLPIFALMRGSVPLKALITITDDVNDMDHITIMSSLIGAQVKLPKPLGKPAEQSKPLSIQVDFNPQKAIHLAFNYGNQLSADLWFEPKGEGFKISRGTVRVGKGKAVVGKQDGVSVEGNLSELDVPAWRRTLALVPNDKSVPSLADSIEHVNLKVGSVTFAGQTIDHLNLVGKKSSQSDWTINLKHKRFNGDIFYQEKANLLSGHFNFLHLPKPVEQKEAKSTNTLSITPEQIPNLNLTIDDLQLGNMDLGNVIIKAHSEKYHWLLDYCKFISPAFNAMIQGDWTAKDNESYTELYADLKIKDLGASLKQWDITPVVEAHYGDIQFKGGWDGPVYDFSLAKLSGALNILIKNGRITKLSPETEEKLGLGKLLSILSLQTIPRRLSLDFSDLSKSGYSFDIFKGHFALDNGVMKTKDSYIDGPVAHASIKGDLDLKGRLYDLNLHVSPHITASLPIVATIAGGPIAGIAAWVASKIINKGMQTISGYTYKISGPWLEPVVQQVSIIKKRK